MLDWVFTALDPSGLAPHRHHRLLLTELEAVSRGDTDRLMVLMPPGSAKSTYTSVVFPAWWFVTYPRNSIIAASHTASLAQHFGRQVRSLVMEHESTLGYGLASDSRAAGRWRTTSGGEYFATGVRGPITGRRADLVIIDDPVRSQADAESRWQRDHLWDWYRADLVTRLKPKGRVILIMTRWHEDDLAGRLLARRPEEWRLIRLPALAEENDLLGRAPGEALWPEWEDCAALLRKRETLGDRAWSAMFQQSPKPLQGSLFKVGQVSIIDRPAPHADDKVVRAWDLAATTADGRNDPDWTVGLKLLRGRDGRWVVIDIVRLRGTPRGVDEAVVAAARMDGRSVRIGLPEDPGQAGKGQVAHFARLLAGFMVTASRETGSKVIRANPVASQVEPGNISIVRAEWNQLFLEELSDFPHGRKDDQVDALCRAFGMLSDAPDPIRRVGVSFVGR